MLSHIDSTHVFYEFIPADGQGVSTFWLPSPLLKTVLLVRLHLQTCLTTLTIL